MQADMRIEILYSPRCPSFPRMKEMVERAVRELGLRAEISVREVRSREEARALRFLGSPTVMVNGEDLEPGARGAFHLA